MSRAKPLILVYAQDLGGARSILPVVRRLLQDETLSVKVIVHGRAVALFRQEGVPADPLESIEPALPLTLATATRLVTRLAPALLFASSSHPRDPSNGYLIWAAREAGIPTVALVEHWKGWERFRPSPGEAMLFVPGLLGVPDRLAYELYVAEGLRPEAVRIVGHPYLEQIVRERDQWCEAARVASLKARMGIGRNDSVVLFCSETIHDHEYHSFCRKSCVPLTEVFIKGKRIMTWLQETVAKQATDSGRVLHLVVRPHPNQKTLPCPGVQVLDQEAFSDVEAVALSMAVLGLSTMPLVEAGVLGKSAASLAFFDGWHPSRVFFKPSLWERQPFFSVLTKAEQLGNFLASSLAGENTRRLPLAFEQEVLAGSTERCLNLLKSSLCLVNQETAAH